MPYLSRSLPQEAALQSLWWPRRDGRNVWELRTPLLRKPRPMHTHCQSVCWSLGNPKSPRQSCTPCL